MSASCRRTKSSAIMQLVKPDCQALGFVLIRVTNLGFLSLGLRVQGLGFRAVWSLGFTA